MKQIPTKQIFALLVSAFLVLPAFAQDQAPELTAPGEGTVNGFKISPLEIGFGRPTECVADVIDAQGRFWRIGLNEKGAAHLLTVPSEQVKGVDPMKAQEVDLYIGHAPPERISAQASELGALLLLSGSTDLIDRLLTADRLRLEWSVYTVALAYGDFAPINKGLQDCIAESGSVHGSRLDQITSADMEALLNSIQEEAQRFKTPPTEVKAWEDSDAPAALYRFGPASGVVMLVGFLNEPALDAWTQQTIANQQSQCGEMLSVRELKVVKSAMPVDDMRIVMAECKMSDTVVRVSFTTALMHGAIGLTVTTEAPVPFERRDELGKRVLAQSDAVIAALAKKLKAGWPDLIQ